MAIHMMIENKGRKRRPYRVMILTVFGLWLALVTKSIYTELETTYNVVGGTHAELVHEYRDCFRQEYYVKYPIRCSISRANPPTSFFSAWMAVAFNHVAWCGISSCSSLLSWNGIFTFLVAAAFNAPRAHMIIQWLLGWVVA